MCSFREPNFLIFDEYQKIMVIHNFWKQWHFVLREHWTHNFHCSPQFNAARCGVNMGARICIVLSYTESIHLWLLHKNRHACDANNNCIGYLEKCICVLQYIARPCVCVCVCVLVRIYAKSHFISHLPFLLVHLWSVTVYVQIMQAPHGKNIILTFTKTMQTQKKTERERDLTTEDKWRLS